MPRDKDKDDLYSLDEYWVPALLPEIEVVWGEHPIFKHQKTELCYSAFLTIYNTADDADVRTRREIQKAFLAGAESGTGMFTRQSLKKYGKTMPTRSFVNKVLGNLCDVTFSRTPVRIWTGDDKRDAVWAKAYAEARSDQMFLQAYKLATTSNVVLVRPYYNRRGKKRFAVIPRDMFRMITEDDGETLKEVWIPHTTTLAGGKRLTVFQVWTDDRMWYTDNRANPIPDPFGDMQPDGSNPYGRIPYVPLRLQESPNQDSYGPGWHDLATIQVFNNTAQLAETRNAFYNSFKALVALNMNLKRNNLVIAPDAILEMNGVVGGEEGTGSLIPPQLDTIDMQGSYKTLQEWRVAVVREFMSNEGIPRHFYEEFVNAVSGVALQVLEREPARMRQAHKIPLVAFETDLAEVAAIVWNTDRTDPPPESERLVVVPDAFSVTYPGEPLYLEPTAAYALDKQQMSDGVLYPSIFFGRYSGDNATMTDEQAVQAMERNKRFLKGDFREEIAEVGGLKAEGGPSLLETVGGSNAVAGLQEKYYSGVLPLEAVVANVRLIYGMPEEKAKELFPPIEKPVPPPDPAEATKDVTA